MRVHASLTKQVNVPTWLTPIDKFPAMCGASGLSLKKFCYPFRKEFTRVLENAIDVLRKREELKAKRNLLFARFLKNPLDTQLALKIKIIDDQVAECSEQMQQMRERRY
jgi:hypothetical protein